MNSDNNQPPTSAGPSQPGDLGVLAKKNRTSQSGFFKWLRRSFNPFRIATLRGLAIVLPPLLTIIFFVWAWNTIDRAILHPIESLARQAVVYFIDDTQTDTAVRKMVSSGADGGPGARYSEIEGERIFVNSAGSGYSQIKSNWIPLEVVELVRTNPGEMPLNSSRDYYLRYVQLRFLKRHLVIPAFMALFLALMYLIGKLLAAGLGRLFYRYFEGLIDRVPIIRNVYSSVKQVTDFAFTDNDIQFNRVIAVEYPCKGVWSMGFVTGESMLDIRNAAGEPMLSVLMPTSPMPATGFTVSVAKSQTIELNITIDQAIQFCVSCGVVIPEHQMSKAMIEKDGKRRTGIETNHNP